MIVNPSDKYKLDNTYYYNNEEYEDLESFIQVGILGMCGCGNVKANLLYVLGGLELINDWLSKSNKDFKQDYNDWVIKTEKYHGSVGAAYFFYYWLNDYCFMEHGGSVPGWFTDNGKELLELLREYKDSFS